MNETIQTILVFIALAIAVGFLAKKFLWKKPAKANANKQGCGTGDCGCH